MRRAGGETHLSGLCAPEPDLVDGLVHRVRDEERDRERRVERGGLDDERREREVLARVLGREVREVRAAVHEQAPDDERGEHDVRPERERVVRGAERERLFAVEREAGVARLERPERAHDCEYETMVSTCDA